MVHTCAIHGCHNRADDKIKRGFYSIPTVRIHEGQQTEELSSKRREMWISRINRKGFKPSVHTKICADHFITGKPSALYDSTNPDWAPSKKLCADSPLPSSKATATMMGRYERAKARKSKRERYDAASALMELSVLSDQQLADTDTIQSTSISEEECMNVTEEESGDDQNPVSSVCDSELCQKTSSECQRLLTENLHLRSELQDTQITLDSFRNNDVKVNYYTGLPSFQTLFVLFELISDFIPESSRSSLSKFQKLILVLMKFRHNFPVQDLGYRFGVSQATVSRAFVMMIHVMYHRLKRYVYWPEREHLQLSMPMEFRKRFGVKVCVIIDCFEIFIERPSNLTARSKTWSSYKHHNTVKYLIGVTPQGSVSFLSKGWGGRTSDKHITENSGLLDKLLPGDLVLADRGFDIADSVGLKCAQVKIPAFTKGKSQLSALEVENTRNIAHVRIHVERVIGLVRNKYTILSGTLPIDYLLTSGNEIPTIDKIVNVCCSLVNFCGSVVPSN